MSEYTCVRKYRRKGENIWLTQSRECGRPAKFWYDNRGPTLTPLCGIHAATADKDRLRPIEEQSHDAA